MPLPKITKRIAAALISLVLVTVVFGYENDFDFPFGDYSVTGYGFGEKDETRGYHMGEDAEGDAGKAVHASGAGVVKHARVRDGYGLVVIIEHELPPGDPYGDRVCTLYGHMRDRDKQVSEGQSVSKGQLLGYLGNREENGDTPPHLHFAVFKGGYSTTWIYYGYDGAGDINNCWHPSEFVNYNRGDTTPPRLTWTSYPPYDRWYRTDERVGWSLADSESGVDGWGSSWDTEPSSLTSHDSSGFAQLSWAGAENWMTLKVRGWDKAGNSKLEILGHFGYDTSPPYFNDVLGPPQDTWTEGTGQFTWWLRDAVSGPSRHRYRWNEGAWTEWATNPVGEQGGDMRRPPYVGSAEVPADLPEGVNTLFAEIEDNAWTGGSHEGNKAIFPVATVRKFTGALIGHYTHPSGVVGGQRLLARVNISKPAPAGGLLVKLSDDSSAVSTPETVLVPEGQSGANYTVITKPVMSDVTRYIRATWGSSSRLAAVALKKLAVTSLSVSPSEVVGGVNTTGTVTLNTAAGENGQAIAISDDSGSIATPASVKVLAGTLTQSFVIGTANVSSAATRHVFASVNGVTRSANLTLKPLGLLTLTISPSSVVGGQGSTGKVTLNAPAPAGGINVVIQDNSSSVTTPGSVKVPAGSTNVAFAINTSAVATTSTRSVSATYGGITKTASITLTP